MASKYSQWSQLATGATHHQECDIALGGLTIRVMTTNFSISEPEIIIKCLVYNCAPLIVTSKKICKIMMLRTGKNPNHCLTEFTNDRVGILLLTEKQTILQHIVMSFEHDNLICFNIPLWEDKLSNSCY